MTKRAFIITAAVLLLAVSAIRLGEDPRTNAVQSAQTRNISPRATVTESISIGNDESNIEEVEPEANMLAIDDVTESQPLETNPDGLENFEWWAQQWRDHEDRFIAQTKDPDWAISMENEIYARVSLIPEFSATTLDAECRESMCRLKVYFPPSTSAIIAFYRQIQPMLRDLNHDSQVAASTLAEEPVQSTIVYLTFDREQALRSLDLVQAII